MNAMNYTKLESRLLERSGLVIFTVAIVARLANLLSIEDIGEFALAEDSPIYWQGAKAWLDAGYFSRATSSGYVLETERVPLYHLFLVPFRWAFGELLAPTLVVQSIVDAYTCVMIAKLCGKKRLKLGLVAGILAAVWPNLIIHSQFIFGDTLFVFLFTTFLYFVVRFTETGHWSALLFAGFFCGLAIMTRSVALFVPFIAAVAAPIVLWRVHGRCLPGIAAALAMVFAVLLVLSPLLWRNVTQFGTYQLTSQGGSHFLNWVVGYAVGLEEGKPFDQATREIQERLRTKLKRQSRKHLTEIGPFESSATQMEHVFEELENISVSTLAKAWFFGAAMNLGTPSIVIDPRVRKFNKKSMINASGFHLFDRILSFLKGNDSRYVFWTVIGIVLSGASCILQLSGMIILLRSCFWPTVFGCLVIAYFLLVNGPVGAPKYRLPFEPVMIIFQSAALISIVAWIVRFRENHRRAPAH